MFITLLVLSACRPGPGTGSPLVGTGPSESPTVELPSDALPATRLLGDGVFVPRMRLAAWDAGDFDGDGVLELALGSEDRTGMGEWWDQRGWIIDGETPSGSAFERVEAQLVPEANGRFPHAFALGDLDGDGAEEFRALERIFLGGDLPLSITPAQGVDVAERLASCDLNVDGQRDVCGVRYIHFGPVDPTSLDYPGDLGACTDGVDLRFAAPVEGWDEDFVVLDAENTVMTFDWASATDGLCALHSSQSWSVGLDSLWPTDVAVGDFTGDGVSDVGVFVPDGGDRVRTLSVHPGPGLPEVSAPHLAIGVTGAGRHTVGDFDGDGVLDVAWADDGIVSVHRGPLAEGRIGPADATARFHRDDGGGVTNFFPVFVHDIDQDDQDDLVLSDTRDEDGGIEAGKVYIVWSGGIGSNARNEPL